MDESGDLDELVPAMCTIGVARAEVDRIDVARREIGDIRPGLLRLDPTCPGTHERLDERVRQDDLSWWRVTGDLDLGSSADKLFEVGTGTRRRAIGRIAEADGCHCHIRNHVVRDPGLEPRRAENFREGEPADHRRPRLVVQHGSQTVDCPLDCVVGLPGSGGVAAHAPERETCAHVSETTGVNLSVRGFQQDCQSGVVNSVRAGEECREWVVLRRKLLPSEEQQTHVVGAGPLGRQVSDELDGDSHTGLHVARAQPVHGAAFDTPWDVRLSGNGVVVSREHDEGSPRAALGEKEERFVVGVDGIQLRRYEPEQMLSDGPFAATLGRNVHELERPLGETVGERGHVRSVPRHNPSVTPRQPDRAPGAEPERGFVVGVFPKGVDGEAELAELRELARTAGVATIGEVVQHRARPDPQTFVGKGKLTELKDAYASAEAEVLLVDEELSPTQQRSLENALEARVVDRTQLILDIFAQHASSAEGKLQVELAQLEYNLPRMRGLWQHLERLGGGVGTRGPGESQLETDRRLARTRVSLVKRRLRGLSAQRATRRKERERTSVPTIALAGYTNVGKTTLLNALTGADASVDDRLFETLDPTTRGYEHDGKRYLVTDTVGFIRRLPTQLVEGFAATLEETLVADLVLHVVDGSLPEDRLRETIAAVQAVLSEIGADEVPLELVLNKVDVLDPLARRRIGHAFPRALQVSAETGEGLDELRERVSELFSDRFEDVRLLVPYEDGRSLARLYGLGAPIAERRDTPEGVRIRARLPRREIPRFAQFLVAGEADRDSGAEVSTR